MTVQTEPVDSPDPSSRRPSKANPVRDAIIIVLLLIVAAGIAWQGGLLRSKPKIALISSTEAPYWDRVFLGAEAAGKEFNIEVVTVRSKADENAQNQTIRDLLDKGYNALAVSPIHPQTQASFLNEVSGKAALVTVDSDCPGSNRAAFVGTDNYHAGRICGDLVRDAIPDGGEVIISVGSIEKDNGRLRRQGLIDTLLDRPVDPARAADPIDAPLKGDKYSIVATLIDNVDTAKATSLTADAVKQHPNVKCIVGLFAYTTPAVLDALKQSDKLGKIKVVGFDDAEATLAGIESGTVFGTLLQDQFNMGYQAVLVLRGLSERAPGAKGSEQNAYLYCTALTRAEDVKLYRMRAQKQ